MNEEIVIASEAKQSRATRKTGLLRRFAPRNDVDMTQPSRDTMRPRDVEISPQ
jgi:hypothetical protein